MARKFSFSLAPIKVPAKPEKQTSEPAPTEMATHRRRHSKDGVAPPNMALISRQRIDPKTEQELRAACALILQNFKPSDHDLPPADPKLGFRAPHGRREQKTEASQIRVHRPTGAPADPSISHHARKHSNKADSATKSYPDLPMRANTGRRRAEDVDNMDVDTGTKRHAKSHTTDAPRQAIVRTETDPEDIISVGTPLTGSTDMHLHNGSTAPTSVAVTNRSSKRTSRQLGDPAAVADAQAAEWMRQELEKRRHQLATQPQADPQTAERPPSRATSITSGIRNYIFPSSRDLSRTQSRESLRSQSSSQRKGSGSSQGWRSWSLNRMSSSRNSSRPGTSSGRMERAEQDKKGELDLNRELPPLPSLDTWKEPEPAKKQAKSQAQGAHIATLMRTHDQQQQDYAAAARQHHRKSGSESLTMRYANAYPPAPRIKSPIAITSTKSSNRLVPEDQLRVHAHEHMLPPTVPVSRLSSDGRSHLNFSRKISTDGARPDCPFDADSYPNVVQVSATHAQSKQEQKSKLNRVLSGWMLKKDKKEQDWMQKLEKEGIRSGVMVQDEEAALPPVVRY